MEVIGWRIVGDIYYRKQLSETSYDSFEAIAKKILLNSLSLDHMRPINAGTFADTFTLIICYQEVAVLFTHPNIANKEPQRNLCIWYVANFQAEVLLVVSKDNLLLARVYSAVQHTLPLDFQLQVDIGEHPGNKV